jgi:hypothetical protein
MNGKKKPQKKNDFIPQNNGSNEKLMKEALNIMGITV